MEIQLTSKESEDYFYNCLCNALGYFRGYGLEFEYNQKDYDTAKLHLVETVANPEETICFEDVLMQMLKNGASLTFKDIEGGEYTRTVTIKEVHERVQKSPIEKLLQMKNEEDDVYTADAILQTVLFEEIIFG